MSGNPGGRTRGLAKYIRDQTKDGFELVDRMLQLSRGEILVKKWVSSDGVPVEVDCEPDHKERFVATKFLIERGCGREIEPAADDAVPDVSLGKVSTAELLRIFELVRRAPADTPAIADDDAEGE